jgi:hypothetical protein
VDVDADVDADGVRVWRVTMGMVVQLWVHCRLRQAFHAMINNRLFRFFIVCVNYTAMFNVT